MTINNVAPTVTLAAGNDLSVNEGTKHTYAFTVTDPGADTLLSRRHQLWRGTVRRSGPTATTATGGSFVCSFPDGDASIDVSVQVKDSDDALSNTDTQTVTINNVAPTVTLAAATTCRSTRAPSTRTPSRSPTRVTTPSAWSSVSCGANGSQVGSHHDDGGRWQLRCAVPGW